MCPLIGCFIRVYCNKKNMEHLKGPLTGFLTNCIAIVMNLISFEAINQLLTLTISILAITYWIAKLKYLKKGKK